MKIQNVRINLGRTVKHENNSYSMELALQADLEPDEDFESIYYSVRQTLEGHLDNWEHEIRSNDKPSIITIPEIASASAPPLVTASDMVPKSSTPKKSTPKMTQHQAEPQNYITQESHQEPSTQEYICPSCGEQMFPKEGKEYLLCTKHWAYPDMIKKGIAKERKF